MGDVTRRWLGLVLICLASGQASVPLYADEAKDPLMVMTVLEARVAADRLGEVERVFREGTSFLPPEIVETYLVRETKDPSLFRLTTVWRSMADLQKMRQSGEKPKGVQMFEAVGVTPTLSIFEIVLHRSH
jgi:heme-degrading monooxygenase HmoA